MKKILIALLFLTSSRTHSQTASEPCAKSKYPGSVSIKTSTATLDNSKSYSFIVPGENARRLTDTTYIIKHLRIDDDCRETTDTVLDIEKKIPNPVPRRLSIFITMSMRGKTVIAPWHVLDIHINK